MLITLKTITVVHTHVLKFNYMQYVMHTQFLILIVYVIGYFEI